MLYYYSNYQNGCIETCSESSEQSEVKELKNFIRKMKNPDDIDTELQQ